MARLILEAGGERREFRVAGAVVIGRLQSNSVFIDDRMLSREHTKVYFDGRRYFVEDLESKNGTYLNGALIRRAESLKNGDVIRISKYQFRFELDPNEATGPVQAPAPAPVAAPVPEPAAASPRATRPRPPAPEEPSVVAGFLLYLILIPVFGAATFAFKIGFGLLFDRLPR